MNVLAVLLLVLGTSQLAFGSPIEWKTALGPRPPAEVTLHAAPDDGSQTVRIVHAASDGRTIRLFHIEDPGLERLQWRLEGRVRYEGVEGQGYLELLNALPKGTFFTRSLAPGGPLGRLEGSSDWRPFILPFDATEAGTSAHALTFNVVLPGRGTVELADVRLEEGRASPPNMTRLFASMGSAIGVLGALLGLFVALGRARKLTFFLWWLASAACISAITLGAMALSSPFSAPAGKSAILVGGAGVVMLLFARRSIMQRYREQELRRMNALDVV